MFLPMSTLKEKFIQLFGYTANFASAVRDFPYCLIFKTTNYCWYKCPHCCENSGPHNKKTYISDETICNYLTQAINDPKFDRNVVFTGGEIFSAYRFYDTQYVPNLLKFSLHNGVGTDIKTNAAWSTTSFGRDIFKDLKRIIIDAPKTPHGLPKLQISLSVDKFHTNCFEKNIKLIKELAGLPVIINLSSFQDQKDIMKEFEKQLFRYVKTEEAFLMSETNTVKPVTLIGKHTILLKPSFAVLFDGGRAQNMPEARKNDFPQFTFFYPDNAHILTAFDSFGRVTLGENSGHKIGTPWVDNNQNPKTLKQIHSELVRNTRKEDLYHNCYERFFRPLR